MNVFQSVFGIMTTHGIMISASECYKVDLGHHWDSGNSFHNFLLVSSMLCKEINQSAQTNLSINGYKNFTICEIYLYQDTTIRNIHTSTILFSLAF